MAEGFFKSDTIKQTEEAMERMLSLMGICHYKGDSEAVEHCKREYKRLLEIHTKAMEEWLAVW